ncbi:MAG TPA: hypothetical protein VNX40_12945 [Mucilaginibacter sp.]|jgi:hypothetical protein|nr:hypothetical protein [Mucilaginibacter sp.]
MNFSFSSEKAKYINDKAIELSSQLIIVESEEPTHKTENQPAYTFLKNKGTIDLSNMMTGDRYDFVVDVNQKIKEKYITINKRRFGFNEQGFLEICKIVSNIQKDKMFYLTISERFLSDIIFEWTIDKFIRKKDVRSLSDHVIQHCNEEAQLFNVYIPILYLEADFQFVIGMVSFSYISDEYINSLATKIEESFRSGYVETLGNYKGQIFAICCIEAEKEKAIEIAVQQTTNAIDTLRIMSPTVQLPELPCYFDLDLRNIHQISSYVLTQPLSNLQGVSVVTNSKPKPFIIEKTSWEVINREGLKFVHDFLLKTLHEKTELEALILNSISNFSKAIATLNLHERNVQLFTVLESLLLPGEDVPIIDSIVKYLPKLVTTDLEQRKLIITVAKEMYSVRSAMVHHAKKKTFKIDSIRIIQVCCRGLILSLIKLSFTKKTKTEILKEIDDRIMLV